MDVARPYSALPPVGNVWAGFRADSATRAGAVVFAVAVRTLAQPK